MTALSSPTATLLAPSNAVSAPPVYVASQRGDLWQSSSTSGSFTNFGPGVTQPSLALCQYNTLVIASIQLNGLYQKTVGSTATFGAIIGSPHGSVLGVIGQFLMAGNIEAAPNTFPHLVIWSSIGSPTDWPLPGSDSALASQAGEQFLHLKHGAVTGIYGGDQWGIITQQQ